MSKRASYERNVQPKLELIKHWCRDGLIDKEIWTRLGISEASFYKWSKLHEEFEESLKNNKEIADYRVEDSLLKSAMGFTVITTEDKLIEGEKVTLTKETYYPPVPVSIFYWLKNRKKSVWRDKPIEESTGGLEEQLKSLATLAQLINSPVENRTLDDE